MTSLEKKRFDAPVERRDFHQREAAKLVPVYDVISSEALRVRNRVQNQQAIAGAGWSAFRSRLARSTFTAASAGKRVHAVTPACTRQGCSGCGVLVRHG